MKARRQIGVAALALAVWVAAGAASGASGPTQTAPAPSGAPLQVTYYFLPG